MPRRARLPRERESGCGADGNVKFVAVVSAPVTGAHSGAVAPAGVRVTVGLALRPAVVEELLAVPIGRNVGGVDSDLAAHLRVVLAQRGGQGVEASGDPLAFLAELRGEAVAGPMRRSAAESVGQARMLRDQVGHARPSRERVERLDQTGAEHRPSAVVAAAASAVQRDRRISTGAARARARGRPPGTAGRPRTSPRPRLPPARRTGVSLIPSTSASACWWLPA